MRIHIGVSPGGAKKGQAAFVMVEHLQLAPATPKGRIEIRHTVLHVERMMPTLEAVRDRIHGLVEIARSSKPCFFIDVTGSLGAGVYKVLTIERRRGNWPEEVHHPHAYTRRGTGRQGLVNSIVEAYGSGRLVLPEDLPNRAELIKALGTYESQVADDGKVSFGGDEELVLALGLAIAYDSHGHTPRYVQRGGKVANSRVESSDPY